MTISIFELFSIGIGPSSSHTIGPMRAAHYFSTQLETQGLLKHTHTLTVDLYGSLALTGKGHGTPPAILMGLEGHLPEHIDPTDVYPRVTAIKNNQTLSLLNQHAIIFQIDEHLVEHKNTYLPRHANGMTFTAYKDNGDILLEETLYSIGGGFIVTDAAFEEQFASPVKVPYPFDTAKELLHHCHTHGLTIADVMLANETTWQDEETTIHGLKAIQAVMNQCIEKGCHASGILPGGLNVERRAPRLYAHCLSLEQDNNASEKRIMQWLNTWAIAVNEENAAGGRIVTAPTNGAAGIIPAVLNYHLIFSPNATEDDVIPFLLTAGAIAILYKKGASISAAEVGCQGEVGVACSMAAAALAAVLGGSLAQIENAAEIGMEHFLGLTCDPARGLVQIPCIERNAMGSVQAVNAAHLALAGTGKHHVSLDAVITTMLKTGEAMHHRFKESSPEDGLSVNFPEC